MPTNYPKFSPRDLERWNQKIEPSAVDRLAAPDACVLWTASKNARGYGVFRLDNRSLLAHRVAYVQANGQIPDGALVRHTCDDPACVNPRHLVLGTPADNSADMVERGRFADQSGEKNGRAKLDWAKVDEIRARLEAGESQRALAEEFGVSQPHLSDIKLGRTWQRQDVPVVPKKARSDRGKRRRGRSSPIEADEKTTRRFWKKVAKAGPDDCWEWQAAKDSSGYGAFNICGRVRGAHLVSYLIANGKMAENDVAHTCANRACVNPAHLKDTTRTSNMQNPETRRRISKKARGGRRNTKLTDEQIRFVKERFRDDKLLSARKLADELGNVVTPECLANIRKGKTGRHVKVPGFRARKVTPKRAAAMRAC